MPMKLDTIFFATDFSKNARRALPFAAEIASRAGSKLTLFHASQSALDFTPGFEQEKEKVVREAGREFDTLISGLNEEGRYKDLEISTLVQSGHPTVGLLEKAVEQKAGLIVMGTQGATGNRNVLFGSTASGIINKSDIPVLAVPPGSSVESLKHLAFATDYHEGDFKALKQAIEFAELFTARVDVVHVAEERTLLSEIKFRGFRDLVEEQAGYEDISFEIKYDYDFFPAMADYFVDHPDCLLVMVRYKKTFWEQLVERDHSREMAFYSRVPALVLIGN